MSQTQVVVAPQPQAPKPIPVVKLNGATPAPEAPKTPPAPDAAALESRWAELKAEQTRLKSSMDELTKQGRRHSAERQKFSQEKGALLKELEEARKYKAQREQFKLNPEGFLKAELGDDYYDRLTSMRLSGGAPPAQVIQSEIQALNEKWEARFKEEFSKRDTEAKTAQQTQAQQRLEGARRQVQAEAQDFIKTHGVEYPALAVMGDESGLVRMLAQRIESEYAKSERRDSQTGELLIPGRVLSAKEAADLVEKDIVALVEKVTATEKWKSRSQASTPSGEQVQQRRTLTNSTTARTTSGRPAVSDEERRERAIQAYNEKAARNAS